MLLELLVLLCNGIVALLVGLVALRQATVKARLDEYNGVVESFLRRIVARLEELDSDGGKAPEGPYGRY